MWCLTVYTGLQVTDVIISQMILGGMTDIGKLSAPQKISQDGD